MGIYRVLQENPLDQIDRILIQGNTIRITAASCSGSMHIPGRITFPHHGLPPAGYLIFEVKPPSLMV